MYTLYRYAIPIEMSVYQLPESICLKSLSKHHLNCIY